jgi:hypothetical protein
MAVAMRRLEFLRFSIWEIARMDNARKGAAFRFAKMNAA